MKTRNQLHATDRKSRRTRSLQQQRQDVSMSPPPRNRQSFYVGAPQCQKQNLRKVIQPKLLAEIPFDEQDYSSSSCDSNKDFSTPVNYYKSQLQGNNMFVSPLSLNQKTKLNLFKQQATKQHSLTVRKESADLKIFSVL